MAAALTLLLIVCLLQGAPSTEFQVTMPQNINALRGSCVTIPCSFEVGRDHDKNLDDTCKAVWKTDQHTVVFHSSDSQQTIGELTGDLKRKDCTTTLNNMKPEHSNTYFFRVDCNNALKWNFQEQKVEISVIDDPPTPTLSPSTLRVEEGTSVSLSCSAPAPCLSHPPTLTWTPHLGDSQETLQENPDKTKVKTSSVTFTASYLHHRQKISCTAVYTKQDGSTESSVSSLTAYIQWAPSAEFQVTMPPNINALRGSCVTIPCSFEVRDIYKSDLDDTCKAVWKTDQHTVVFHSSDSQQSTIEGELTGDLKRKDCTTTLNNMKPEHSKVYFFRVDCNNPLKWNFQEQKVEISVIDDLPTPTLSPSTLRVEEGTSVSLSCSAPAPCLSHPPTLTWTPHLGHSQETLQENPDKTKVKTSSVTFTASYLHHRQKISCTAVYTKQDGSTESSVSSLTAYIQYSPKTTTVSVRPSGPVPENSSVSLTCSNSANPAVRSYTWYRADRDQETVIGTGEVLNIKASEVSHPFFCKAENYLGAQRSNITQIDVQYAPKHTTVSVHPSGPVPEHNIVTLTCSSSANPAVKNYTWYRADGDQETVIGTGEVLNIRASKVSKPFFCKVENVLGAERSNINQIDVQFAPQILSSSECTKAADQLNCSCETVGNPSPTLQWYLDGSPVNHSDKFAIISDSLNNTRVRDVIIVNQPQERSLSTLLCRSSNSLGSADHRFYFYFFETQTPAESQGHMMLTVFIATVAMLLVLVFALLLVIRAQRTRHNLRKSTDDMSQLPTSPERNEVSDKAEEEIYANANVQKQAGVAPPTAVSEPNNAEGASGSTEKKNAEGCDVLYASVTFKTKKKKAEDTVDMDQPGNSYLEEERCMVGSMGRNFVSNALEMGNLYDEVEPSNVKKEVECEYAQVKFKKRKTMQK